MPSASAQEKVDLMLRAVSKGIVGDNVISLLGLFAGSSSARLRGNPLIGKPVHRCGFMASSVRCRSIVTSAVSDETGMMISFMRKSRISIMSSRIWRSNLKSRPCSICMAS